jgi:hypothetical protein
VEDLTFERAVAAVRARLTADAFRAAWAEGKWMDFEQAVAYALADAPAVIFNGKRFSGALDDGVRGAWANDAVPVPAAASSDSGRA